MRLRLFLRVIFGAVAASFSMPSAAHAQPAAADVPPPSIQPGCTQADVDALWSQRQAAKIGGRMVEADRLLEQVMACKIRAGWPDFFAHGEALAVESRQAAKANNSKAAVHLAHVAADLAPHRIAPHMAVAQAERQAGNYKAAITGVSAALGVLLHEAPYRLAWLSAYGLWLLFALAMALVGLAMAGLYRYGVPLWHDASHLLPRRLAPVSQGALTFVVVMLPALLRLGPLTWALVWLLVLAPYLRRRERVAATVATTTLAMLLAAMPYIGQAIAYSGSNAEAAYLATRDLGAEAAAQRLGASPSPTPQDCYSLGLRARWQGNIADSRRWLERALRGHVTGADAVTALGNARWLQQAPNEAMAAYKKAITQEPTNVYALFNLSQARLALVTEPLDDARRLANTTDFRLVSRLAATAKKTGIPVAEPPIPGYLLARAVHRGTDHAQAMAQLLRPLAGPVPRQAHLVLLVFLSLYMVWLSLPNVRSRRTTDCRRCGDAVCHRCVRGPAGRTHCAVCAKLANPSAAADRQARIQKEIASHRFFARRLAMQRRFAWAFPGAGQLLKGEAAFGLSVLTAFFVCALGLATFYGWLNEVAPNYTGLAGPFAVLHGAIALTLYVVALVFGLREEQ